MPQQFQVLQCYSCKLFQVHQVKKVKKWNCKVCGEKQSVIKVFGCGTGADCRKHVQKLNMIRGSAQESKETTEQPAQKQSFFETLPVTNEDQPSNFQTASKWENYIEHEDGNDDMAEHDVTQYTTDRNTFNQVKRQAWKERKNRCKGNPNQHVEDPRSYSFNQSAPYSRRKPYNWDVQQTVEKSENNTSIKCAPLSSSSVRSYNLPTGADCVKVTREYAAHTMNNQNNSQFRDENTINSYSSNLTKSTSLNNVVKKSHKFAKTSATKSQVASSSKWAMFTEQPDPSGDEDENEIEDGEYREQAENDMSLVSTDIDVSSNAISGAINSQSSGDHFHFNSEGLNSHNRKPLNVKNLFNVDENFDDVLEDW